METPARFAMSFRVTLTMKYPVLSEDIIYHANSIFQRKEKIPFFRKNGISDV
jgi:hypothetical protein